MMAGYDLARAALFTLDPETAHRLALRGLDVAERLGLLRLLIGDRPVVQFEQTPSEQTPFEQTGRTVMGLRFSNPVGLAAGMDKNGDHIAALSALGFGFLELGTVTPRPQPGNPRPRLFRLPRARAIINRMGFNNRGVDYLVERLREARPFCSNWDGVLGVNIGKNRDTPMERAIDDYLICLRKVYPHAGYVAVNISSPNTPGLRDLQRGDALDGLLSALKRESQALAERHGRYVPLAIKIAPDLDEAELQAFADAARKHHVDAVIATNTTLSREGVAGLPHAEESGGLSGSPLLARANSVLGRLSRMLGNEMPLIGVGGVTSAQDALAKLRAGASLVQIYSGFVYCGPGLVREIVEAIA